MVIKLKKDAEAMLFDDNCRDDTWKFLDYNDEQSPDIKYRVLSEYDLELAVELHYLFFVHLKNLISNRVQITKKKHWV